MALNASATKTNVPSPDELRANLLRVYPTVSLGGLVIILVVIAIFAWSWTASRPTAINRINGPLDPFFAMGDLIGRMFPPQFELSADT